MSYFLISTINKIIPVSIALAGTTSGRGIIDCNWSDWLVTHSVLQEMLPVLVLGCKEICSMGTVTSICTTEVAASAVGAALEMSSLTSSHLRLTHVFSYIESLSYSTHAFYEKKTQSQIQDFYWTHFLIQQNCFDKTFTK